VSDATRSPTRKPSTLFPSASATPAISYPGTTGSSDGRGVVNVNVLDNQSSLPRTADPMLFDGESVEAQATRRVRGWTAVRMSGAA
jgi:hypothetical protein